MLDHGLAVRLRHWIKRIPGACEAYYGLRLLFVPTYREDGLCTIHNAEFREEANFRSAYEAGLKMQPGSSMRWRSHVAQWAGYQAGFLEGDFVECGVNRAFFSTSIIDAVGFREMTDRKFYLIDTYTGLVPEQLSEVDKAAHWNEYPDVYEFVRDAFEEVENICVVQGVVPEVLSTLEIDRVAYLSIDMNCLAPELAAVEHFWPKMVPGGVILLDDYGWRGHEAQKHGLDDFAASVNARILSLPTGQGLLIKHPEGAADGTPSVP